MAENKTKNNEEQINSTKKEIKNTQESINAETENINNLQSEIEVLEGLKTRLKNEKEEIKSQKKQLENRYATATEWRGDQYNGFLGQISILQSEYESAYNRADALLDSICDEITRRKNDINSSEGILGWLKSKMNDLANTLETLTN
ncbi:MAG: DUF5082 family protein [Lachnospiraceae bacterium]|nr:DUF5082 domain-containing protein [Lachnospiraceae bacterium]MDY4616791.1 DUF5082 family protein [Lachnospiraceae bacterium]